MKLIIGWGLSGPCFWGEADERARLGEPTWGPNELLRDLELRLGLPHEEAPDSLRIPKYRARIEQLASEGAFYARSFKVDPLGTARALLRWRDALVDAGWDGGPVPNGGERLEALTAIEQTEADPLPCALADRLVRVERALQALSAPVAHYEELVLVEDRSLWSARWRNIFQLLEATGTKFVQWKPSTPGAPPDTDLGVLQRLMCGEPLAERNVRGDGSLLLVRGETPDEVAELTAALLRHWKHDALVVRSTDPAPLEVALRRQGLACQGNVSRSAWRPAMQVLPLALELAFEPKDPRRVLELLTLPVGPFRGHIGSSLARALAKQPGIGGQEWTRRKARLQDVLRDLRLEELRSTGEPQAEIQADAYVAERMRRVEEWLEVRGAGPEGARREDLIAMVQRVSDWLRKRWVRGPEVYSVAYAQAVGFSEALVHDTRAVLSREEARQLLDDVVRSADGYALSQEQAGRMPHVTHPSAVLAPTSTVVFWGFVSEAQWRPPVMPWNRAERVALEAHGVCFVDPGQTLACEANAWRRAVLAARERAVFVVPNRVAGQPMSSHPLWDEIAARLSLDDATTAKLTLEVQALLGSSKDTNVEVELLSPLRLPAARPEWSVPPDVLKSITDGRTTSATAMQSLASCPLRWVLEEADVQNGVLATIPDGPLLNGNLGHRLVEKLFRDGAFEKGESEFLERVDAVLPELVRTEAATLLLPGAVFEWAQLQRQLRTSLRELYRYLAIAGFRIAAVEETVETDSAVGKVIARLDLRLVDEAGKSAVLDLKWGAGRYEALLEDGKAVQLATYARALRARGDAKAPFPPAGYFSLSSGKAISADARMRTPKLLEGASLDETWSALERTLVAVKKSLKRGRVLVGGTEEAPELLDALAVPEAQKEKYFAVEKDAVCDYCEYSSVCGRAWEDFQ